MFPIHIFIFVAFFSTQLFWFKFQISASNSTRWHPIPFHSIQYTQPSYPTINSKCPGRGKSPNNGLVLHFHKPIRFRGPTRASSSIWQILRAWLRAGWVCIETFLVPISIHDIYILYTIFKISIYYIANRKSYDKRSWSSFK